MYPRKEQTRAAIITITVVQLNTRSMPGTLGPWCRQAMLCQIRRMSSSGGSSRFIIEFGRNTILIPITTAAVTNIGRYSRMPCVRCLWRSLISRATTVAISTQRRLRKGADESPFTLAVLRIPYFSLQSRIARCHCLPKLEISFGYGVWP